MLPVRARHLVSQMKTVCTGQSSLVLSTCAVPAHCALQMPHAKQPSLVVMPDQHKANRQLPMLLGHRGRIVKGHCVNDEAASPMVEATQTKHLWDSNASAALARAKQGMLDAVPVDVESLMLGEDLFRDYLQPAAGLPAKTFQQNVEYMRELVLHMKATGQAPDTERIDVNQDSVVIGGNHRVLAAWLLRWPTINCCSCGYKAGWHVPLDEEQRKPLEALLGLDQSLI